MKIYMDVCCYNRPFDDQSQDRIQIEKLYSIASVHIDSEQAISTRAKELNAIGFGILDSLHLAYSEYAKADVFLTTDDALINRAKTTNNLEVKVINPVQWILEVK